MLKELTINEMNLVSGGLEDDEVITQAEKIPDSPGLSEPNFGGFNGLAYYGGAANDTQDYFGGGSGFPSEPAGGPVTPMPNEEPEEDNSQQDRLDCIGDSAVSGANRGATIGEAIGGVIGGRAGSGGRRLGRENGAIAGFHLGAAIGGGIGAVICQ